MLNLYFFITNLLNLSKQISKIVSSLYLKIIKFVIWHIFYTCYNDTGILNIRWLPTSYKKGSRYVYGEGFYNSFISSYSSIIYSLLFLIEYKKLPNHKN